MQSTRAAHWVLKKPSINFIRGPKTQDLVRGDRAAGVIRPDGIDEARDACAASAAPEEVVARRLDEELVLAGRDGRRDERLGVGHVLVGGSVGEA